MYLSGNSGIEIMKYEKIDKSLFEDNRRRFKEQLIPGSLAIFNSNDIITTSADSTMPFVQHRDIFHLSGVDQEESILVIFPDCSTEKNREILFLKETNEHIAVWEGEKLTKAAAYETSKIKTVYWLNEFETVFNTLMAEANNIYLNNNELHAQIPKPKRVKTDSFHGARKNTPIIRIIVALRLYIKYDP